MKMKKIAAVLASAVFLCFMVGCKSSAPAEKETAAAQPVNLPEWLNEIAPEDVIWGIGSAKQSNDSFSMTTAENRARVAIARQIDASVQAMFTDYNRDAGTSGSQANLSLQEDISRTLTQAKLNGTVTNAKWRAPDGTWWMRVEYKKSDAKNTVANIFDSEAAQYAEFKADQALQMMDAQLAKKNETPARVSN
ncbi:MAG: LPP20 family lipoprotein [Spirochaetaceae bacterium]|jgi:hypothetical protein|nr:LPP20 family lipoprotein [Spirochaetaceae bacterium]